MVRNKRRTTKRNIMTTATPSKRRAAGSRVPATRSVASLGTAFGYLSPAQQQELNDMDKTIAKITSSKEEALAFLKEAGILNRTGKLAKIYRPA